MAAPRPWTSLTPSKPLGGASSGGPLSPREAGGACRPAPGFHPRSGVAVTTCLHRPLLYLSSYNPRPGQPFCRHPLVSGTSGPGRAEDQRLLLTRGPCGARERLWTPPGAGAIRAERGPGPVRWASGRWTSVVLTCASRLPPLLLSFQDDTPSAISLPRTRVFLLPGSPCSPTLVKGETVVLTDRMVSLLSPDPAGATGGQGPACAWGAGRAEAWLDPEALGCGRGGKEPQTTAACRTGALSASVGTHVSTGRH